MAQTQIEKLKKWEVIYDKGYKRKTALSEVNKQKNLGSAKSKLNGATRSQALM